MPLVKASACFLQQFRSTDTRKHTRTITRTCTYTGFVWDGDKSARYGNLEREPAGKGSCGRKAAGVGGIGGRRKRAGEPAAIVHAQGGAERAEDQAPEKRGRGRPRKVLCPLLFKSIEAAISSSRH